MIKNFAYSYWNVYEKFHIQCYTFFANVRLNACSNKNANTYRLILWKLDSKICSLFLMPYFIYQNYRIRDIEHESNYELFLTIKILFGKKLPYFNQRSCRFIDSTCCCYFSKIHSSCSDVSYSSWRHLYMCWQHLLSSITLNIEICLIILYCNILYWNIAIIFNNYISKLTVYFPYKTMISNINLVEMNIKNVISRDWNVLWKWYMLKLAHEVKRKLQFNQCLILKAQTKGRQSSIIHISWLERKLQWKI